MKSVPQSSTVIEHSRKTYSVTTQNISIGIFVVNQKIFRGLIDSGMLCTQGSICVWLRLHNTFLSKAISSFRINYRTKLRMTASLWKENVSRGDGQYSPSWVLKRKCKLWKHLCSSNVRMSGRAKRPMLMVRSSEMYAIEWE